METADYKDYEKQDKEMMELLDKIEKIRRDNNKHWMNILRLAFKAEPKKSKLLMAKIVGMDRQITELTERLANL